MTRQAFVNGRFLIGEQFVESVVIEVSDGRIERVVQGSIDDADRQLIDLQGKLLAPGYVDLQVNGGGDRLFNDDPETATLQTIADAHRRSGTTAWMPTLISDRVETMSRALQAVSSADREQLGILGVHFEGPALAPAKKGVHDRAALQFFSNDLREIYCDRQCGQVLITIAPEQISDDELRALVHNGVIVSIGHSNAGFEDTNDAFKAGASGVTHLFNAMSPWLGREPGVVGAALSNPDVWVGLIADGHHVHWQSLRLALTLKPTGKCFLVSDAMPPAGGSAPGFTLNDEFISCSGSRCTTADGTLGGSCATLADLVRLTHRNLGVSKAEACRMASLYPAEFIGQDNRVGSIAEGRRADFVILDDELNVIDVWFGGVRQTG